MWSYENPDRYAIFAGSAQRLDDGNTVIGWASATAAVASEVDSDGDLVWDLKAAGTPTYFTYRAVKTDVPDTQAPRVHVTVPTRQGSYVAGRSLTPEVSCTDRGGSTLQTCEIPELDTTPGTHRFTVTATDGAGHTTTVTRRYTMRPRHQPDAQIRLGSGGWAGVDRWSTGGGQRVTAPLARGGSVTARVRIVNDGVHQDRFVVARPHGPAGYGVTPHFPPQRRTGLLEPGQSWTFRLTVTRQTGARGSRADIPVLVRTVGHRSSSDLVVLRVRAVH